MRAFANAALACALVFGACACFSPDLGEGRIHCGLGGSCPPSLHCASDLRCYTAGAGPRSDGGGPGRDGCVPLACGASGPSCGMAEDGCGKMLDCGACMGSAVCGGDGTANACCTPLTACQ